MNTSITQLKGSLDLAKMDHAAFNSQASKDALDVAQAAYDAAVAAEAADTVDGGEAKIGAPLQAGIGSVQSGLAALRTSFFNAGLAYRDALQEAGIDMEDDLRNVGLPDALATNATAGDAEPIGNQAPATGDQDKAPEQAEKPAVPATGQDGSAAQQKPADPDADPEKKSEE